MKKGPDWGFEITRVLAIIFGLAVFLMQLFDVADAKSFNNAYVICYIFTLLIALLSSTYATMPAVKLIINFIVQSLLFGCAYIYEVKISNNEIFFKHYTLLQAKSFIFDITLLALFSQFIITKIIDKLTNSIPPRD